MRSLSPLDLHMLIPLPAVSLSHHPCLTWFYTRRPSLITKAKLSPLAVCPHGSCTFSTVILPHYWNNLLNGLILFFLLKYSLVFFPRHFFSLAVKAQLKCYHLRKSIPDPTRLFLTPLELSWKYIQNPVGHNKSYKLEPWPKNFSQCTIERYTIWWWCREW